MILQEIIRRKRDGETLFGSEIAGLVSAITDGSATEGQSRPSPWRASSGASTPRRRCS